MARQHLVLGTAGHIDHGKTALIKAMTGIDTDRLKEEKERGISIELGYAQLELPSGTRMSVVDVPGHERFVRNMVAGASGIDIFLLVVAADDGVMPQTREHMAIIELLGIPQGLVAITKTDLVDEEMVELVKADIEDFLSATPYAGSPVAAVSSKTGAGLPQLLGMLEEAAAKAQARQASPATRLPVDRVFSLKGIGTVVTGTLWAGQICAEDALWLLPDHLAARARGVQVHDRAVECAEAGQRVAINISGIDKEKLSRGQMIVTGDELTPTYMVDARISLIESAPGPLKYGAQARFHHGTADATAKLMFADRDRLAPGESCFAQVRLKTLIVPARGDRFILRSLSPVTTIGGGVVVDPMPRKHGQGEEHVLRLETLQGGSPAEIVALFLQEAVPGGLTAAELVARSQLTPEVVGTALGDETVGARGSAGADIYFSPEWLAEFSRMALEALTRRQKDSPADPSMTAEAIARATGMTASSRDYQELMAGLVERGEVAFKDSRYSLASAEAKLSKSQKKAIESIERILAEAGLAPPALPELGKTAGAQPQEVKLLMKLLVDGGKAVKVKPDLYFAPEPMEKARRAVIEKCRRDGRITLAEFRDILGISRKFAQALLEYFDRTGITRREGDYRALRKKAI
ncbi:MAG: selenocysteine-specific translation elongation factor [Thermoleophilia bacterium]|nr:selenocysteine-specific translation elongation factor [Thermoleophilia bacterium]